MPHHPNPLLPHDLTAMLAGLFADLHVADMCPADAAYTTQLSILVLALSAQWQTKMAALVPMVREPLGAGPQATAIAAAFATALTTQSAAATQATRAMRARLYQDADAQEAWWPPKDETKRYDGYEWPLFKLLQLLPGNITDVPELSDEERQMCVSVAALAQVAGADLLDGMASLGRLLDVANAALPADDARALGRLLVHLTQTGHFMVHCAAEYGAAAQHIASTNGRSNTRRYRAPGKILRK